MVNAQSMLSQGQVAQTASVCLAPSPRRHRTFTLQRNVNGNMKIVIVELRSLKKSNRQNLCSIL